MIRRLCRQTSAARRIVLRRADKIKPRAILPAAKRDEHILIGIVRYIQRHPISPRQLRSVLLKHVSDGADGEIPIADATGLAEWCVVIVALDQSARGPISEVRAA